MSDIATQSEGAESRAQSLPSDAELVGLFKAGDESAFDRIVERHRERIHQFSCRLLLDADDACDVVQETFVRAYQKLGRFRGEAALYTWLYRIAYNLCVNTLRRRKLRVLFDFGEEVLERPAAGGPEQDLADAELRRQVDRAVEELPPQQRSIFALRYFDGLAHREIAAVLGCSEGAVRAGYFHAVKKLQITLKDVLKP